MIKKLLSFLIISFVGISFCSSFSCNSSQNYCWDIDINQSIGSTRGTVIDNNLNFYGLTFDYYNGNDRLLSIWWQDDGLFRTARNSNINITAFNRKGYINGYYICTKRLTEGVDITDMSFCSYQSDTFTGLSLGLKNNDKYMFNCLNTNSNSNYVSCSVCSYNSDGGDYYCVDNRVHAVGNINSFWSREEIMYYATNNPYSNNTYGGNNNNRNNNQVCPTLGQILNNYDKNYNTGMCYNNTIIYNNGQIETVDKRNIQQIFTDYEELSNRRNIYNNNCKTIFTREKCMNAFSGNLDKYEIISKGINEKAEPKRLRNYCNIYLNYDLNLSSCVASGRKGEPFTPEEIKNTLTSLNDLTIKTPATGNILNGLLEEGETRANPLDILGNMDQIKDKFTILFEERKGVNGIIPGYIIWIMLLTILLTVLFKK